MPKRIPFYIPDYGVEETRNVRDLLLASAYGKPFSFLAACSAQLEEEYGAGRVVLTSSGTAALEMIAMLLRIKKGDEVILPAFTFPATAEAFCLYGARPVFADVQSATLNLDPAQVRKLLTRKTRAIIAVHYGGTACDLKALRAIAKHSGIPLIEDNAHGFLGGYKGHALGTFGEFAALSFHETKNISAGQGGALIVNQRKYLKRAYQLRDNGTDRHMYFQGRRKFYSWVDHGSSFGMSEIHAAVLLAQLHKKKHIQNSRKRIFETYWKSLGAWAVKHDVTLPRFDSSCLPSWHLFYLKMRNRPQREALMEHLRRKGIQTAFHFMPLNRSRMGRQLSGKQWYCPVAESASERILRLPLYPALQLKDVERIIDAILNFSPSLRGMP